MSPTNAEHQKAWRKRRNALAKEAERKLIKFRAKDGLVGRGLAGVQIYDNDHDPEDDFPGGSYSMQIEMDSGCAVNITYPKNGGDPSVTLWRGTAEVAWIPPDNSRFTWPLEWMLNATKDGATLSEALRGLEDIKRNVEEMSELVEQGRQVKLELLMRVISHYDPEFASEVAAQPGSLEDRLHYAMKRLDGIQPKPKERFDA